MVGWLVSLGWYAAPAAFEAGQGPEVVSAGLTADGCRFAAGIAPSPLASDVSVEVVAYSCANRTAC